MIQFNSVVLSVLLPEVGRLRDVRLLVSLSVQLDPLPAATRLLHLEVSEMFVLVQTGGSQQVSLPDPPHSAILAQPRHAARPPSGPAGLWGTQRFSLLVLPATGASHDCTQSGQCSHSPDTNCMEIPQFTTSSTPGTGGRAAFFTFTGL